MLSGSTARVILVIANIETLCFFKILWVKQFPFSYLPIVTKDLVYILIKTDIEGHNSERVRSEIANASPACMFPGRLSRQDQISVIAPQNQGKYDEKKQDYHEKDENGMNMVQLVPLNIVTLVSIILTCLPIRLMSNPES